MRAGRMLLTLEALGLVNRIGEKIAPAYRLVFHVGLWLFCEKVSRSAKFYYGNDSIELSRMLEGARVAMCWTCVPASGRKLWCAPGPRHMLPRLRSSHWPRSCSGSTPP